MVGNGFAIGDFGVFDGGFGDTWFGGYAIKGIGDRCEVASVFLYAAALGVCVWLGIYWGVYA